MKRPAFQFYPDNWRNNANLRRCSWAARGVWLEVMCLMHDSDHYGVLAWPVKEIAQALGCTMAPLKELVDKGVLKGCDKGECNAFIYTPRSGRKDGEPVTLIPAQVGPIWYSSRMIKDEYLRSIRGDATRFAGNLSGTPTNAPMGAIGAPKVAPPIEPPLDIQSDGSSTPSPPLGKEEEAKASLSEPLTLVPPITPCPIDDLIDRYCARLPMLPGIRKSLFKAGKNADAMRSRWRWVMTSIHEKGERKGLRLATTVDDGIDWFDRYFGFVAESDFLTGKNGKWTACDLAWLLTASKFEAVLGGKYHQKEEIAA